MIVTEVIIRVDLRLQFTREEAKALVEAGELHYSPECRPYAFQPLGALRNILAQGDPNPAWTFNWRELDILSKICESPIVPAELADEVWAAFRRLRNETHRYEEEKNGART